MAAFGGAEIHFFVYECVDAIHAQVYSEGERTELVMNTKQFEIQALIDAIRETKLEAVRESQSKPSANADAASVLPADVRARLNALLITFAGETNLREIEQMLKRSA
jgi:hypothetical protein